MKFLISAGEASGDTYGAQLMAALRERVPGAQFFGLGGQGMRAAGCDTVIKAEDVAVVGLFEVVKHLPRIHSEFKRLVRAVEERRPDAAILIDFPDFNFRLARQLHRRGIPVFYYISPQLWAWRSGRIKLVQRYVKEMLVIFPFEQEWYRQRGVEAHYVGHPLADLPTPAVSRAEFARQYRLDPERTWIALLPGSRRREIAMNLPTLLSAAARLGDEFQFLLPVAATISPSWVHTELAGSSVPVALTQDARATLFHSHAAAVASGTATVETALLGTPFVMVYRVSPLSWTLGRHLVRVPFYGMVNLIAGREVVPELVQQRFTPEAVASALGAIIPDGDARRRMQDELALVRAALHAARDQQSAAARAAEFVLGTAPAPALTSGTIGRQS